jgi:hypothetical protein
MFLPRRLVANATETRKYVESVDCNLERSSTRDVFSLDWSRTRIGVATNGNCNSMLQTEEIFCLLKTCSESQGALTSTLATTCSERIIKMRKYLLGALLILILMCNAFFIIMNRPSHILLEEELTCAITNNAKSYADFIMERYGSDRDLQKVHLYLYQHGFYLRNFEKNTFVYISDGDGSKCLLRKLGVDVSTIIIRTEDRYKILSWGE